MAGEQAPVGGDIDEGEDNMVEDDETHDIADSDDDDVLVDQVGHGLDEDDSSYGHHGDEESESEDSHEEGGHGRESHDVPASTSSVIPSETSSPAIFTHSIRLDQTVRSKLPSSDPSLSTTLSQSNQTMQSAVVPPVPLFSCPLSQTVQTTQYEVRSSTFSMPPPAFRTCSTNALATTSTSTSIVPLIQQSYRLAHMEDLQRDLDLMKSGECAYLEQFRTMQEDLATRGTAKDTPVIDLDDVDNVGLYDRLRVAAERREAELTLLAEAVAERDPASGAGGTSQAASTSASGTGGVVGSKSSQDVEDQKPDIKPGLYLDYFDRLGTRLLERALQKVNKLEEVVEMLQKEKEVKEKEEKEKEARELEKKARRKAKKLETERELALNRERIVALEQKFFELGNRPPVIATTLPPIANSVSEL